MRAGAPVEGEGETERVQDQRIGAPYADEMRRKEECREGRSEEAAAERKDPSVVRFARRRVHREAAEDERDAPEGGDGGNEGGEVRRLEKVSMCRQMKQEVDAGERARQSRGDLPGQSSNRAAGKV